LSFRKDLSFEIDVYKIGTVGGFKSWYIINTETERYYQALMDNFEITEKQLAMHALGHSDIVDKQKGEK